MQSVPIATNVSLNPTHGEVYLMQHYVIVSVTCNMSVVSSTNKTDRNNITEILLKVTLNTIPPLVDNAASGKYSIN